MIVWRRLLISGMVQHTAIAFVDRALLSITNFTIGLLLIRRAPATDYGLFVLAQAAMLFAFFVQSALISIPMTILAPKYSAEGKRHFVNALAQGQYLIWLPLAGVVALVTLVLSHFDGLSPDIAHTILVVDIVMLAVLLREFMRSAFFVYMRPGAVLCVDAIYGITAMAAAAVVTTLSSTPALHTLLGIGLANLLACLSGLMPFHSYVGWRLAWPTGALAATLQHGKWALMGAIVTWLQTEGFLYLLSALRGTPEVASVSASRLLLMPIVLLTSSFEAIIKPRGAAWLANQERRTMEQSLTLLTGAALGFSALYILGIWLMDESIVTLVFQADVAEMRPLLVLWGGVFLLRICSTHLNIVLQILERFDTLFYIGMVSAIISLTVGYGAIQHLGAPGCLLGLVVVEVVGLTGMGMWLYWHRQLTVALPKLWEL